MVNVVLSYSKISHYISSPSLREFLIKSVAGVQITLGKGQC